MPDFEKPKAQPSAEDLMGDVMEASVRFNAEDIAAKTEGYESSNNERMFNKLKQEIQKEAKRNPGADLEAQVTEEITVENPESYTVTTYAYKMLYVNGKYTLYRKYVDEKENPKSEDELQSEKSQDLADTLAWAEATAEEFLVDYEETDIAEVPTKYIKLPKAGQAMVGHETKEGATTYYVVCQGRHQDYYVYKSDTKKRGARI